MNSSSPRRATGIISLGHFLHDVFGAFFAPLLPLLRDHLGFSLAEAGVLAALQRLPSLGNPLLGVVADRGATRWMLVAAPTITAVAMSLIGLANSQAALGALLLVAGVGSALWHVPAPAVLASLSSKGVGARMSLFMVAGEGARAVGPMVALGAVSLWGPEGLTRLAPVGLLASTLMWYSTRDVTAQGRRQRGDEGAAAEPWGPLLRLFAAIAVVVTGRSVLVASLTTFLPTFVVERGGSLWLGGAALAIMQGAGAVGALSSGTLSDRIGRRRVLMLVALGSPPALAALVFAPPVLMVPLLIVIGLFAFSTNPPMLALVQERAGGRPAVANGIFMTLGFVIRSGVVIFVGALADARGLEFAYLVAASVAVIAVPGVWLLPRDQGALGSQSNS